MKLVNKKNLISIYDNSVILFLIKVSGNINFISQPERLLLLKIVKTGRC